MPTRMQVAVEGHSVANSGDSRTCGCGSTCSPARCRDPLLAHAISAAGADLARRSDRRRAPPADGNGRSLELTEMLWASPRSATCDERARDSELLDNGRGLGLTVDARQKWLPIPRLRPRLDAPSITCDRTCLLDGCSFDHQSLADLTIADSNRDDPAAARDREGAGRRRVDHAGRGHVRRRRQGGASRNVPMPVIPPRTSPPMGEPAHGRDHTGVGIEYLKTL
jgi:hypothetical protein